MDVLRLKMDIFSLKFFEKIKTWPVLILPKLTKTIIVIIKLLFSQNNCSNSNFNQKFDYEFGTQGLLRKSSGL